MFVLLYRVCTHVRPGILEAIICVYICVVVEGMYTCKRGHSVNGPLCLGFGYCRGYAHMQDWAFWKRALFLCICCYIGY